MHDLPASSPRDDLGDTVGWPQLTHAVAAQDAALVRAGQPPISIFTGYYGEAAALDVLGSADRPPPCSPAAPAALPLTCGGRSGCNGG